MKPIVIREDAYLDPIYAYTSLYFLFRAQNDKACAFLADLVSHTNAGVLEKFLQCICLPDVEKITAIYDRYTSSSVLSSKSNLFPSDLSLWPNYYSWEPIDRDSFKFHFLE